MEELTGIMDALVSRRPELAAGLIDDLVQDRLSSGRMRGIDPMVVGRHAGWLAEALAEDVDALDRMGSMLPTGFPKERRARGAVQYAIGVLCDRAAIQALGSGTLRNEDHDLASAGRMLMSAHAAAAVTDAVATERTRRRDLPMTA